MRTLASIKKIEEIALIEGADLICAYRVDGWWVVDQKDKYQINDLVVYCEIDSWIPTEIASFLSKGKEPREYLGIKGERLRTIRLKGQISQGLLLPITIPQLDYWDSESEQYLSNEDLYQEDEDVTEALGIVKYEPPVPAQLAGVAKGNFPSFIPKTDEDRIQGLGRSFNSWKEIGYEWTKTEKLDGSSMTVYIAKVDGEIEFGVCSRNLNLKKQSEGNSFWEAAKRYDLENKLTQWNLETNRQIAIQSELIGLGIQGNKYNLNDRDMYMFRVYDIDAGKFWNVDEKLKLCEYLGIKHVPILGTVKLTDLTVEDILKDAEDKSVLNNRTEREGVVYTCYEANQPHFKAISNRFLLKNSDD
jgi:RNA ligase (TIGR02306 family)